MALDPTVDEWLVHIPADGHLAVEGTLALPARPRGVVLFIDAPGTPRTSPRSDYLSRFVLCGGLGTLRVDLITAEEEAEDRFIGHPHFHLRLLIERGLRAVDWLARQPLTAELPLGLLGAGNGAAAALMVAERLPERVRAVVSRGGRPELAVPFLHRVRCPTLFIVGDEDPEQLAAHEEALGVMQCVRHLEVVSGASHLFEESQALQQVASLARDWFLEHLGSSTERAPSADLRRG